MTTELNRFQRIKSLLQDTKLIDSHTISLVVAECDMVLTQRPAAQEVAPKVIDWHAVTLSLDEAHDESLDGRHGVARAMLREVCANIRASLPAPQQATPEPVPRSVFIAGNDTAMCAFAARDLADRYVSNFGGATAGGMTVVELPVVGATPEPVGEPDTVPLDALHAAERERDYWKTRARAMLDHAEGTCWYWMGDGEDHLESLVSSLPVVIRADQLRELLACPAPVETEPVGQVSDLFPSVRNKLHAQGFDADAPLFTRPAPGVPELLPALEGLLEAAEWLCGGRDEATLTDDVCRAMNKARAAALAAAQAKGGEQ